MNEEDNQMENEECRVIIMVHDIKPPFLEGANVSTNQAEQVQVVKDPKADLAVLARKGSAILKFIRERNDRSLMKERFWELAGSKMGNIMKIKKDEVKQEDTKVNDDGSVDYKADLQYAPSIKKKFGPASEFSKTKTLLEQREFLPIFGIKEELMKVINQNKMFIV
jgi:pre-mRNA-splicing factor ATP-dependent RNA helicase DHX38/PRP16